MDPAPDPTLRDRAERHVFATLPELDAVGRRALALAELAGVPRAGIASEVGLAGADLSAVLAGARKSLRRSRAPLGSAGRCERAERALSDRLDACASDRDELYLEAHLARCPRCRAHDTELRAAREALIAAFEAAHAPAVTAEPEPEPPAKPPRSPRNLLRVVPTPPLLPPAPDRPALEEAPAAEQPPIETPPAAGTLPPAAAAHANDEPPAAAAGARTPATAAPRRDAVVAARARAALPVAVAVLVAVGLIAAAIALLSRGEAPVRAPWDGPDAPVVHPTPLSGQ